MSGMDCRTAESMVTRFIDHSLSVNELEEFLDHIEHCSSCYDELETYKLLLLVSDKKEMKDYEQKYLGAVLEYDESNNTDYLQFIKLFLENGANVQQLANSMFVHRNTIHYKMNKIKEIAGINLGNLDDLLKLKLSLYIKDIR